ncbi:hypothetical protein O181_000549 [Austropuccinia psidii MF-1]|uniref:Uncharacterized protein n=1 Tax=Austropuccinia psidii MF-1 TaxID=1389203 RepID=A0A9Q3B8Q5_9BASI|nr:hypothetical protein [Austropuccinia psidii MF-1]
MEGRKSAKKINIFFRSFWSFPWNFKGLGEDCEEEEEDSDGIEVVPDPVGASESTLGPTIAQYNQPFSNQSDPSLLEIMQQVTGIMDSLQAASTLNLLRNQTSLMGLNPSKSEALFSPSSLFFITIRQISLKTRRRFFIPLHFSLAGLQNELSLFFPISPNKNQANFSRAGRYSNSNT